MAVISIRRLLLDISAILWLPITLVNLSYFAVSPKKQSVPFLAMSLSLFGYLLIPYDNWDLARHYYSFDLISQMTLFEVLHYEHFRYLPLHIYMWFLSTLGLPREALPAISIFFAYFLTLKMYCEMMESRYFSKTLQCCFFLFLWSVIPFVGIASSLRQHLAFIMFIYGIYKLNYKRSQAGYVWMLISTLVHVSSVPVVLIYFLSRIKKNYTYSRYVIAVVAVVMLSGLNNEILFWLTELSKDILIKNEMYFFEYFDRDTLLQLKEGLSRGEYILKFFISPSFFYLSLFFYVFVKHDSGVCKFQDSIYTFLFYLLFFLLIVSPSETMFSRFSFVYTLCVILYLVSGGWYSLGIRLKMVFIVMVLLFSIVVGVAKLNAYKLIIQPSWSSIFYMPAVFIPLSRGTASSMLLEVDGK